MSDVRGVTEVKGIKEYRYFAGGEWLAAEGNKLFDVYQPYDRALYARVAAGGRKEAKLAVEAAANAFPAWAKTTPAERLSNAHFWFDLLNQSDEKCGSSESLVSIAAMLDGPKRVSG